MVVVYWHKGHVDLCQWCTYVCVMQGETPVKSNMFTTVCNSVVIETELISGAGAPVWEGCMYCAIP